MGTFLIENSHWLWICLGLVLITAEILGGAGYLLATGSAALLVAVVAWLFPELALTWQLSLFTLLALCAAVAWTRYFRNRGAVSQHPGLGTHGSELIGRVITLQQPLEDGLGQVRLADANWRLRAEGAPRLVAGDKVRILAVQGNELAVEPLPVSGKG